MRLRRGVRSLLRVRNHHRPAARIGPRRQEPGRPGRPASRWNRSRAGSTGAQHAQSALNRA